MMRGLVAGSVVKETHPMVGWGAHVVKRGRGGLNVYGPISKFSLLYIRFPMDPGDSLLNNVSQYLR